VGGRGKRPLNLQLIKCRVVCSGAAIHATHLLRAYLLREAPITANFVSRHPKPHGKSAVYCSAESGYKTFVVSVHNIN
jgi:hypothetical protein